MTISKLKNYTVAGSPVIVNVGESKTGIDWTVTFVASNLTVPLSDVLSLIKPI